MSRTLEAKIRILEKAQKELEAAVVHIYEGGVFYEEISRDYVLNRFSLLRAEVNAKIDFIKNIISELRISGDVIDA